MPNSRRFHYRIKIFSKLVNYLHFSNLDIFPLFTSIIEMKSNLDQLTESLRLSVTESQKAWHVFSLIIFIGKPAPISDLASQCTLFPASPDIISSLCSIPSSPITLSDDKHLVAISSIGLSFFAAYIARNFTVADAFTSLPIPFRNFPKIWLCKRDRYGNFQNEPFFHFFLV